MKLDFYWRHYKYLPYERSLAKRELETLFGCKPTRRVRGLSIEASNNWELLAGRTTYFREAIAENGERIIPLQAMLEASINGNSQDGLPGLYAPVLRRQSTRYSAHGIHEYRGKFNPQIVRTIGNLLGLKAGDWVLDPFCGSGTTLLEAAHIGWNVVGIDINPLGIAIAQAKLAAMKARPEELVTSSRTLEQYLKGRINGLSFDRPLPQAQMQQIGGVDWERKLPDFDYLKAWFAESVLVQVAAILSGIDNVPSQDIQLIFKVLLSNILRDVSLQDPKDLRIRRRKSPPDNMPAISLFLETMANQVDAIIKARRLLPTPTAFQYVVLGDVRQGAAIVESVCPGQCFDAVITSPPYATALPYIDTQRLSLVVLGLLDATEIRPTERTLIGNREISSQERQQLELAIQNNADDLPQGCLAVCRQLSAAVDCRRDGFRRQNVPALTYQYCRDMAAMFGQLRQVLRKNARFVLVVGRNKTRLGGQEFVIDTPTLLTELAKQHKFDVEDMSELDTYQRFDVHQANSIRSETMLILRGI